MRIFLSESLTCGAVPAGREVKASLAVEGAAMLRAVASDAAAVPGWQVAVTWDAALEPFGVEGVEAFLADSAESEASLFRRLAAEADATLVIAPEFGGLLEARCRLVAEAGGRCAGCSPEVISLCGDKLKLAGHLRRHGIPTIGTEPCEFDALATRLAEPPIGGFVVKPRFGAGSIDLFRVRSIDGLAATRAAYANDHPCGEPIVQPFVSGLPLSVAAIVSSNGTEVLPVAEQRIVGERLHYAGGILPADIDSDEAVRDLARRAIATIPGLYGYVGIDLLLPEVGHGFGPPVVVEINPRLTTSYLGYRRLAAGNLAERVLASDVRREAMSWKPGQVEFDAGGASRSIGP